MTDIDELRAMGAYEKVQQVMQHVDSYREEFDDQTALFLCPDGDCIYELAHDDGQLSIGDIRALLDELQSLRAMKTTIEAAVNECEHSLLIWTDAAWNRTVAGDARDFCRAQFGRFGRLRTQLGLPPYQKPPFQEGPFSVVEAASDESFEHIRRQLDELRSAQQWRGIESAALLSDAAIEQACQARSAIPGVRWDDGLTEGVARIERMLSEKAIRAAIEVATGADQ